MFRIRQLQSGIAAIQTRIEGEDLGVSWSWKMEEAKLRWARGEQETAMFLLRSLGKHLEKVLDKSCAELVFQFRVICNEKPSNFIIANGTQKISSAIRET